MNSPAYKPETPPEDIDLLLLLERFISFLKKFRWLILVAALSGLLAGYLFYRSIPKTYHSQLVLHSFLLTNAEEIQIANNWNKLLQQKEYETLGSQLHLSAKILGQIKNIKPKEIQQSFAPANPNGFVINVLVTDNAILDSLQAGLVQGFENSGYVKERLTVKRKGLEGLIAKTETEIKKLDSTKQIIDGILRGKNSSSSNIILDGANINQQLIEMNEKLLGLKETLQFTSAVQVLQGFSKYDKPDGPKLILWLVIGFLVFVCIAWVIALFQNTLRKLRIRKQLADSDL